MCTKAQRGLVICLRLHSWSEVGPGFKPSIAVPDFILLMAACSHLSTHGLYKETQRDKS